MGTIAALQTSMVARHPWSSVDDDALLVGGGGEAPEDDRVVSLVVPPSSWATLVLIEGPLTGAVLSLAPGDSVTLGRSVSADLCIPDESLSPEHAKISWRSSGYVLEPHAARVWLEGAPVMGPTKLTSGARIQLAPNVRLRFDLYDHIEQDLLTGLYRAALRDRLTGAYNRHYLDERLPAELSFAARRSADIALLIVDIDGFKDINDRFGHPAGDAVLRVVAEQLRRSLRPEDVLVRYGGDEFCILLRGLNMTNAALLAGRVVRSVADLRVPVFREHVRLTLSIGIAAADPTRVAPTAAELIASADRALYRAKREGRNRCCQGSERPPAPAASTA